MKTIAKKLFNIKDMDRRDWLKCRQEGIGGSDVAAILGLSKFRTPLDVYISKVEELPETDELADNEYIYWGNVLEDIVAKEFKKRNPEFKVYKSSFMWQHPEYKFMVANVDRLLYHPELGWGVLEIKTASEYRNGDFEGDSIPEDYLIQTQHYVGTLGLGYSYLAALIGGNKYKQFKINRDEDLIETMIDLEKDFWVNNVLAGNPPDVDGSEASSELLKKMYVNADVRDKTEIIDLSASDEELLKQYEEGRELEKQGKALKDEAANKLKNKLGDFQVGFVNGRKVTWSAYEKSYFDQKALIEDDPELALNYTKKKVERRFTIAKAKISG